MKIQFVLVGHSGENTDDIWADLDAIPREGEVVDWPGISQADTYVRTVVWYPRGDPEAGGIDEPVQEPFVYVVVGAQRPDPLEDISGRLSVLGEQLSRLQRRTG